LLNVVFPVLLILGFGIARYRIRKARFTHPLPHKYHEKE
jgi:phage gp36-like protein